LHGKRTSAELIVRVIACLAEGLGIRGTARVFELDPNTVLHWLVEAAEQLRAFSRYVLHDVRVRQVQAAAARALPHVLQFLFAPYQFTPAVTAAPADQRARLSQAVAAVDARDGGGADGSGVDPPGGAPVPRATVATASGGVSKQGGGKRHGKGA
jgi:hypothetical protein